MTILAKRVTDNEDTVYRLDIDKCIEKQEVYYLILLINPEGKKKKIDEGMIIISEKNSENDKYVFKYFGIKKEFLKLTGYYRIHTILMINGLRKYPKSFIDDYFYVDSIETIRLNDNNVIIKNNSKEMTPIWIKTIEEVKKYNIKGNTEIKISVNDKIDYITYANNCCIIPQKKDDTIYSHVHDMFWRLESNGRLLLYMPPRMIKLSGIYVKLWENINGFNSLDDITEKLNMAKELVESYLQKMVERKIITIYKS